MGHAVRLSGGQGDAHSIWVDLETGDAFGANDRRSPDSKASLPGVPADGARSVMRGPRK
jgi:hypothetical protein